MSQIRPRGKSVAAQLLAQFIGIAPLTGTVPLFEPPKLPGVPTGRTHCGRPTFYKAPKPYRSIYQPHQGAKECQRRIAQRTWA